MKAPRLLLALPLLALSALAATETDHPPRPVKQVPVAYTGEMRQNRPKGDVVVDFVVDESGKVTKAAVKKSLSPAADQAALACVRQWLFEPAAKAGRPVKAHLQVPIRFN